MIYMHIYIYMDFIENSLVFMSWFDNVLHHSIACMCSSLKVILSWQDRG